MTKTISYIVVRDAVGVVPYWAIDTSLPKVKARFKRLTGKFPSKHASIVAFAGSFEDLEELTVNDLGDIIYRKSLEKIILQ